MGVEDWCPGDFVVIGRIMGEVMIEKMGEMG